MYHNGKRLKDIYPGYSWFQVLMYRVKIVTRISAILGLMFVLSWIGYNIYTNPQPPIYKAQAEEIVVNKLDKKIADMKEEVVLTIKICESQGYDENDALIKYDPLVSNPKKTAQKDIASIGTFQFKQTTVIDYYKRIYGKDITMKEAALIALEDEKAHELTSDILFKTENGWRNWENCGIKHGLKSKILLIKELEK